MSINIYTPGTGTLSLFFLFFFSWSLSPASWQLDWTRANTASAAANTSEPRCRPVFCFFRDIVHPSADKGGHRTIGLLCDSTEPAYRPKQDQGLSRLVSHLHLARVRWRKVKKASQSLAMNQVVRPTQRVTGRPMLHKPGLNVRGICHSLCTPWRRFVEQPRTYHRFNQLSVSHLSLPKVNE